MRAYRHAALFGVALAFACVLVVALGGVADAQTIGHPVVRGAASLFDAHGIAVASVLAGLRAQRVEIHNQMKALLDAAEAADGRDLSAEEIATYDGLRASRDALDARIARHVDLEASTAALAAVVPGVARRQGVVTPPGPNAPRLFESFGEYMHAVRFNPNDSRLQYVENAGVTDPETGELRGELRMDNNPSGGFMVPVEMRTTIMRVDPQDALVRPRANVLAAGASPDASVTLGALDQTGANPGNMFGGVEVKWIGEGDDKPETDLRLREVTLTPHEVAAFMTITDKLLRNWQGSGSFIEGQFRAAVNGAEDYAFQRGTGVNQPLGPLYAGATKWVNRLTAGHVVYLDLLNMVARFLMRGGSPVWSAPQSALVDLATMTDPEGHYIWKPGAVDGFAGTLLGYPLKWNNRAPALGQKGDIMLNDWSQYLIKDGFGPFVEASQHVKFLSNKTVIKIFWNVDGTPWLTAPIKEENGYEVSPFVGLDVPG